MGLMDDAKDKAGDMKDKAQDMTDSTNMDDKAREEFDRMRGDKRAETDEPKSE